MIIPRRRVLLNSSLLPLPLQRDRRMRMPFNARAQSFPATIRETSSRLINTNAIPSTKGGQIPRVMGDSGFRIPIVGTAAIDGRCSPGDRAYRDDLPGTLLFHYRATALHE